MRIRSLFQEMTDSAHTASTEDELREAVAKLATDYGYERFAYLNLDGLSFKNFAVSNYPLDWQTMYFDRSFMAIDPVVTTGKRIMRPFHWSADEQRRRGSKEERGFWDAAMSFGIKAGLTIPISVRFGQVAMLTLASDQSLQPFEFHDVDCALAATSVAFLHSRLSRAFRPTTRQPGLSEREALCMEWLAAGKTQKDIAAILGLNFHTVRWDIDNVRAKLKARNTKHAISLCAKLRLI